MNKLWILVLTLSTSSTWIFHSVDSFRNDLIPAKQPECIWSTVDGPLGTNSNTNQSSLSMSTSSGGQRQPNFVLDCNLRTLNVDFWNYTFNKDQTVQTSTLKIKCNDKLYFESFLTPNQTLFRLVNLKQVEIDSCKIRKMPGRVWGSLGFLKNLALRSQNGDWSSSVGLDIEQGAFEGLGKLETLELSQNNIWSLPNRNIFCPLKSLLKLNLSRNQLSDIEELGTDPISSIGSSSKDINNSYYCALSVTNLDVSFNTIRRLGNNAFSRMKKISELRLNNNLLEELEDSAFGGLTQLRLVNLSSNRLVALPPSIFRLNPSLREISLKNNSISALSPQVFSGLESLISLDISQNILTSQWIKDNMFHGLVRLVVLKLSQNQLSYLDATIFKDLGNLQALHLDGNRIETIHPEAFNSLNNLRLLDLANSKLTFIDGKVFSPLFALRRLYLDHNKIRKIHDDSLINCTGLLDLGLSDNLLQEVPAALRISNLDNLVTLDIGENKIGVVKNDSFRGLGKLYGLRLVDNRLTELPPGFCDPLKSLRVLNVGQNLIKKISSSAFTSCPELKALRIDSNKVEELPIHLASQLPSLLWLNVSVNSIKWADYHVLPRTIEWLDLSYNLLESLGGSTERSQSSAPYHLRVLEASHNLLTSLDYTTIPPTLETLRVNHNRLKTVSPDTFIRSSRIRRVELIGNQIENLPLTSLRFPATPSGHPLPEFYLGGNPFLCDCTMEWLTRVSQLAILRTHPRIVDLDSIVCRPTFPQQNQEVPLVEMRPNDFLCPYKAHCFALCHCCDFDACDCEMTCPDNCTCFHDNSWAANVVNCASTGHNTIPARLPMDSTEVYLDGNNMSTLGSHSFIGKKNLRVLYMNDSHIEFIRNKTFNGLKSLAVLRLEDNLLTELHGYEFSDLLNLSELYLQNNLIGSIDKMTFSGLNFLRVLRLDGNHLIDFNVWELSGNGYLNSLMLAGNPWTCDCEFLIPFRTWVASKTSIVVDFTLANCQTRNSTHVLTSSSSEMDHYTESVDTASRVIPKPKYHDNTDVKIHTSSKLYPIQIQHAISSMCNHNKELNFNFNPIRTIESELLNNHIQAMGGAEKVQTHPSDHEIQFSPVDSSDEATNTFWTLLLTLTALIILALVIVVIFRKEIHYWLYARVFTNGFTIPILSSSLCCCIEKLGKKSSYEGDDSDKLFDVYIIYGKNEEDIVVDKIAPQLELGDHPGEPKNRVCLHYRDLCLNPDNPWNTDMMLSACDASKRIVLILSRSFYQSEFPKIQSVINQYQKKVILIHLPDLPPFTVQNSSTGKCSILEWSDNKLWSKLKILLPTPSKNHNTTGRGTSLLISGGPPPLIDLGVNGCTMSSYTINRLDCSHNQYHQNILPYQIPISNCSTLTAPVPKHHIALTTPFYHSNHPQYQQQNHYNGSQHSSQLYFGTTNSNQHFMPQHPVSSGSGAVVYPMSTLPSTGQPQNFSFSESFRRHLHHQQHQLQNQKNFQQTPVLQFSKQPQSHNHQPSNNNRTAYQPLEPNYSSSGISSSAEELEHVYSTLDSPLQSPNSANTTSTNLNNSNCGSGGSPNSNGALNSMCINGSANVVTPRVNTRRGNCNNNSNNCNSKRNSCRNNAEFSSQNQSFRCSNSNTNNLPDLPAQNSIQNEAQPGNNGQMYFV